MCLITRILTDVRSLTRLMLCEGLALDDDSPHEVARYQDMQHIEDRRRFLHQGIPSAFDDGTVSL